ncbi:MAG: type I DNA topoisomerase [Chitinophagales bacterium]|nr:type I DNA topoisomerase [Chitinophagales bacterium]
MANNLLIVESPAKAKTIEKILGEDFVVKSSFGHIRDLPKNQLGIDIEKNFQPDYEIPDDKKSLITELKKLAKQKEVWLATDGDREGEAISWHLCEALGLNPITTKRIVFNEITNSAIKNAVAHPRTVDMNLVNAQQARRTLDRLVGFELSPVLWKKLSNRNLSAGRVQSVAVRLVVEREREIIGFESVPVYRVVAVFTVGNNSFRAELNKKFETEKEALDFLEKCINTTFTVADIQVKPGVKSPSAPFTTSTLQQEASRKLGFGVSKTMMVAQKLYESGKITYMRTDSTALSDLAINSAASYIQKTYGNEYSHPTQYATQSTNAQEAHEAIRPTYLENESVNGTRDEQRLYDLIWKRTISSQMSKAKVEKTTVKIDISNRHEIFMASGEVIIFPGFLKVYLESTDEELEDEDSGMLPPLAVSQNLLYRNIEARQRYSKPPARYTEASLVKKLEELGIGRPSTYAPTISTIINRGYVAKGNKEGVKRKVIVLNIQAEDKNVHKEVIKESTGSLKGKLMASDIGMLVNDYLTEHFKHVMEYDFTANIEKDFDRIADNKLDWSKMMKEFYQPFHKAVETSEAEKGKVTGERQLGTDPVSGKPVIARIGRYGPMIQIGTVDDEEKPRFASLLEGQSIHTITFEEAMELFKLPRVVGAFEDKAIKANIGRFGPYIQHDKLFVSLKDISPFSIDEVTAIELIKAKREADSKKLIHEFRDSIQVLNGRYGPYIKKGKDNFKIPKGTDPQTLTEDDVLKIISEAPEKKAKSKRSISKK